MRAGIALNDFMSLGELVVIALGSLLLVARGHPARPEFFLRGSQTGTPAAAEQRADFIHGRIGPRSNSASKPEKRCGSETAWRNRRSGRAQIVRTLKLKRAGSVIAPPARAISIKNKHLLVIYSIPARGFTAAVSVFRGTPPPKPLICKSVLNRPGARLRSQWADPTGREPRFSGAISSFGTTDIIIATSWFIGTHNRFTFRCCHSPSENLLGRGKQKTLLPIGKQGWEKISSRYDITCLPGVRLGISP
jgi:hypothetical protein